MKSSVKPVHLESHDLPRAGEPLWVKVTLRNTGKTTIRVMELVEAWDFQLSVYGKDNHPTPLTALGAFIEQHKDDDGSRSSIWLAPGNSTAKCIQVNALFDMSVYGSYTIVASRKIPSSVSPLITSQPFPVTLDYASTKLRPGVDTEAPDPSIKHTVYGRPHPQHVKHNQ